MTALEQLLAVQALDTHTDQLRHRREALPERAQLADRQKQLAALESQIANVEASKHELVQQQRRIEDEVASLDAKAKDVDKTLYSGTVRIPRELQALQDELGALARRKSQLEDGIIELMEQVEPLEAELATQAERRDALDNEAVALIAAIAEAETAIDAELADIAAQRDPALAGVPPELLAEYETLRARLSGIAIARLTGNRCDGCHLTLPAVDVDTIRHASPGEVVYCSECGRMLVH